MLLCYKPASRSKNGHPCFQHSLLATIASWSSRKGCLLFSVSAELHERWQNSVIKSWADPHQDTQTSLLMYSSGPVTLISHCCRVLVLPKLIPTSETVTCRRQPRPAVPELLRLPSSVCPVLLSLPIERARTRAQPPCWSPGRRVWAAVYAWKQLCFVCFLGKKMIQLCN